ASGAVLHSDTRGGLPCLASHRGRSNCSHRCPRCRPMRRTLSCSALWCRRMSCGATKTRSSRRFPSSRQICSAKRCTPRISWVRKRALITIIRNSSFRSAVLETTAIVRRGASWSGLAEADDLRKAVERDSRGAGAGRACAVPGSGGHGPAPFRPGGIDQLQLAGCRAGGFDADRARLAGAPGNQQLLLRVTEAHQDDVLRRAVGRAEERVVLDDRADRLQHPVCRLEGIVLSEQAEVVLALAFVRAVVAKVVPPVAPYVEYRSDQEEAARQIGGLKAFVDAAAALVGRPAHFREVQRHRLAGDAGQF